MPVSEFDPSPPRRRVLLQHTVRFALVLVCAAFATGLLGRHWWVFDLFAPFRVQYGYVLLSCAILLSLLRDVRWAAPAWAAAVFVAWPVMLSELPSDAAASVAAQEQPAFRVLTLNAWFRNEDIGRVARYLASSDADVILVQEFNRERMDKLAATLPTYPHTAFAAAEDKDGAAILSRWPIESAHPLQLADASRHAQWALVRWHGTAVQVVGVHLPWPLGSSIAAERNAQLYALADWMRTTTGPVVVGGDLNLSRWSPHFHAALERAHAHDALASRPALSTWPTQCPPLAIQIDHCLLSQDWQVARVTRGPRVGSDHYPVMVELRLKSQSVIPRAPGVG